MKKTFFPFSPHHPGHALALAGMFVLCLLLLAGCNKERRAAGSKQNQQARQTLTIGLVTEQDIFKQVHRYEPLAEYLEQRLDMNVRLSVMPSYDKALTTFVENKLDAAFFGSMTYVLAHARLGVEVIARPVALDGTSTYYGVIIVRSDSKIFSSSDMKGKRMAFVDKNTMAGYLHPLAYFKKYGIDYRTYFKEFYFTGTHEDVIYDVLDRKADVGAVKNTVLARLAAEDPKVANGIFIISRTPPVPENGLAVRPDLTASLKEKIRTVLLNMHEDPEGIKALREFKAKKFIATTDRDFHSIYVYTHELGIDVHAEQSTTGP